MISACSINFMFEFHGMVRIKHACYATEIECGRVVKTKHAGATPHATRRAELRGARVAGAGQGRGKAVDALSDYAFHANTGSIMVQAVKLIGASHEAGQAPRLMESVGSGPSIRPGLDYLHYLKWSQCLQYSERGVKGPRVENRTEDPPEPALQNTCQIRGINRCQEITGSNSLNSDPGGFTAVWAPALPHGMPR